MKTASLLLGLSIYLCAGTSTYADGWPVYGGDNGNTRYSKEKQITTENVSNLKVAWSLQLGSLRSQESTPIVIGDTMYVTSSFGPKNVFAVDAKTGEVRWRYSTEMPKGIEQYACCDVNNRGVAVKDDKVIVGRLDAKVAALDSKTGKEIWKTVITDPTMGAVITSPPVIAKNVVITGFAGGEYGVRGAIIGLDLDTGKELWRTYTIPGPGEPGNDTWKGDSWKYGGGAVWNVGSYDPDLNLVYFGTSNASPWSGIVRGNDSIDVGNFTNLYTASVLAINPADGKITWHYQFTPHDVWDYDGVNELVLTELAVEGKSTPVLMQANRNGFFYILDRRDGKLLSAKQFVDNVNWATSVDLNTGRPVEAANNEKRPRLKQKASNICPNLLGGKNWMPMSYDPDLGLVFMPTLNLCMDLEGVHQEYKRGSFYLGVNFDLGKVGPGGHMGGVKAWDPVKQTEVWFNKDELPYTGGVLSTAGGLVFHGDIKGWFKALDAKTGKTLWKFNAGTGISQAPITYEIDGKQYIAVVAGRTLSIPAFVGAIGEQMINASPEGGALFVFELDK